MYIVKLCGALLVLTSVSITSGEDSFTLFGEHVLVKNRLLHTFPVLAKEWKVSFEVNPSTYEEGWRNILRLWFPPRGITSSSGTSCLSISILSSMQCNHLSQCWTYPKRLQYQFISDGYQQEYFHDYDHIPQLNKWTKIEVSQMLDGNSYKIVFNSGAQSSTILSPKTFEGVKVYASDQWNVSVPQAEPF